MPINTWLLIGCILAACMVSYEAGKFVMQIKLKKILADLGQYITKFAEDMRKQQKEGSQVEINQANQNG